MDGRSKKILQEIKTQCQLHNSTEFEYFMEMWGLEWYPWTIEVSPSQRLNFTMTDISAADLKYLEEKGELELIKDYDLSEMNHDEIDRKRLR